MYLKKKSFLSFILLLSIILGNNSVFAVDKLNTEQDNLTNVEDKVKNNNLGKYIVTRDLDGSEVGKYDLFQEATASINPPEEKGAYTITLTEDDLDMGIWGGVSYGYTVTLKSDEGGPYKIVCKRESNTTNSQKHFSQIAGDLILENIILDGDGVGGGVFIMSSYPHDPTNFVSLTMKSGAVIQNCRDVLNSGAAVSTIGDRATLIMEKGSAILNNTHAKRNGGGVNISGGNTFIMNGGVISGNTSEEMNGGGVIINGGTFIMNGGEISGNSAPKSYGGGLCISSNAKFELKGGTISGNTAKDGGGIYIDNRSGKFNISGMTISGNTATDRGGGIFNYPEIVIENSTITDNKSSSSGGGIITFGTLEINNLIISGNSAVNGGGLFYQTQNIAKIKESTISDNIVSNSGGGIFSYDPIEMNKTTITGNSSSSEGGGVFLRQYYIPNGVSKFENVTLENNESKWGGGIEIFAGSATMENCSILNNKTTSSGAGIFTNGSITMNNSTVKGNISPTVGGGIDARASVMTVTNSTIEENKATQGGGGMFLRSDDDKVESIIKNTVINGNEAGIGGGIVLMNKAGAQIGENTKLIGNIAETEGGGVYTDDADYTDPVSLTSYQKLKTDSTVEFSENKAGSGLFNPPSNANELSNIGFSTTSAKGIINPNHPINNYDINYLSDEPVKIVEVVYDANGGEGSFKEDVSTSLKYIVKSNTEVKIKRDGYKFKGWNTKTDGSGTTYQAGDSFVISENQILYAVWEKETTSPPTPTEPEKPVGTIKNITLIGGKATLTEKIEEQLSAFTIHRLAGKDRYATSVEVSKEYGKRDTVVLASGEKYTDELTATVLASKMDVPILLSEKDVVPEVVMKEIERLGAKKVIIVGETGTISKKVEKQLSSYTLERIGGKTRYETAILLGDQIRKITGKTEEVILVDGTNFPDAISMTSMGVEQGIPILLTEPSNLRDSTAKAIKGWKISKVTIGGGTVSVGSSVENKLKETVKVDRIKGADRYETSVLVAKQVYKNPVHAVVASGEVFPDAIVGAPYAAKNKYPIVLSRGNSAPQVVMDYVNGK